jgi:hypothetical protein
MRKYHISTISVIFIVLVASCMRFTHQLQDTVGELPSMPRYVRPLLPPGTTVEPTETHIHVDRDRPYYSTGLSLNNEVGLPTALGGVYWVMARRPISATLEFTNGTLWTRELKVLCLVDYQQVPCLPQAQVISTTVLPSRRGEIEFQIPEMSPGIHTISAIALSYVPLSQQIISEPKRIAELVIRSSDFFWYNDVTVYADTYDKPSLKYVDFPTRESSSMSKGSLIFSTVTNSDASETSLLHPNLLPDFQGKTLRVSKGQSLELYLLSSHDEETPFYQLAKQFDLGMDTSNLPFVIMAFIDTQQIPINDMLVSGPMFSRIPKGKEVIIPIKFTAPEKAGIYSFYVLYQEGPFVKQGAITALEDQGVLYQPFPDILFLNTSDRVILEVVD